MKIDYTKGVPAVVKQLQGYQKLNSSGFLQVTKKCYAYILNNGEQFKDYKLCEWEDYIQLPLTYTNTDSDQGFVYGSFYIGCK